MLRGLYKYIYIYIYIKHKNVHTDIKVLTIREEITKKYRHKITTHPKAPASTIREEEKTRRLKRNKPTDLTT
jgi:hypothetical protein